MYSRYVLGGDGMWIILTIFMFYYAGNIIYDIGTRDKNPMWKTCIMIDMMGLCLMLGLLIKIT